MLISRRTLSLQGKAQKEQVEYETWTAHDLYPCGVTPEQELCSSAQPDERGEASRTGFRRVDTEHATVEIFAHPPSDHRGKPERLNRPNQPPFGPSLRDAAPRDWLFIAISTHRSARCANVSLFTSVRSTPSLYGRSFHRTDRPWRVDTAICIQYGEAVTERGPMEREDVKGQQSAIGATTLLNHSIKSLTCRTLHVLYCTDYMYLYSNIR